MTSRAVPRGGCPMTRGGFRSTCVQDGEGAKIAISLNATSSVVYGDEAEDHMIDVMEEGSKEQIEMYLMRRVMSGLPESCGDPMCGHPCWIYMDFDRALRTGAVQENQDRDLEEGMDHMDPACVINGTYGPGSHEEEDQEGEHEEFGFLDAWSDYI